jgi:hypothetical protein
MLSLEEAKRAVEAALDSGRLSVVVGRCRVAYEGRAASKLSEGDRVLIIKPDGTFLVHQNKGMAAINYQGPGTSVSTKLENGELVLVAENTKPKVREKIEVHFYEVYAADSFALRDDSKLKVFGSEKQLADLLMQDLHLIEAGLVPLKRESEFSKGAMDILAEDSRKRLVVIELKRRTAGLDAVTQLARYVNEVNRRKDRETRGILCAPEVTPNALKMLEREGLEFFKLDYEIGNPSAKIKGLQKKQKALSEY